MKNDVGRGAEGERGMMARLLDRGFILFFSIFTEPSIDTEPVEDALSMTRHLEAMCNRLCPRSEGHVSLFFVYSVYSLVLKCCQAIVERRLGALPAQAPLIRAGDNPGARGHLCLGLGIRF